MDKKSKSFVKGAAILAVAGLFVKILGAVYRIPLNNLIGTDGMAYYAVAYPYYSWLLVISSAGLPAAISKLVSERVTRGDYKAAQKVFKIAFELLVVIGIVTTLIMFAFAKPLANMSGEPKASLSFTALAPSLLFVSVMCAYRGYLQGLQQMTGTALSQVTEQFIKLVAGLVLAKLMLNKGAEYAAQGALIGVTISEFIALLVIAGFYYFKKRQNFGLILETNDESFEPESSKSIIKAIVVMAVPITLGASIMPLTGIADSAFILNTLKESSKATEWARNSNVAPEFSASVETAKMVESWARTAYSIFRSYVTTIINMPAVLTSALAMSLVPAISSYIAARKKKEAKKAAQTAIKLSVLIGAPCTVGLFVLAKPILMLLYRSSLDNIGKINMATAIMQISAIGVLFLSVVQSLTGVIQGLGKPIVPVKNLVVGGVLKVLSMLVLMRFINIYGAALSTVLCYAIAAVLDMIWIIKYMNLKINWLDIIIKPIVASVTMGIYAAFVQALISGAIGTLLAIIVGVGVYAILLVLMKMLNKDDLEFIPGGEKIAKILNIDVD